MFQAGPVGRSRSRLQEQVPFAGRDLALSQRLAAAKVPLGKTPARQRSRSAKLPLGKRDLLAPDLLAPDLRRPKVRAPF
jgi:hypothetical protein